MSRREASAVHPKMETVQWLFLDPSVLLNESESERELRRLVATGLNRRGRTVSEGDVERAWMQAISGTQPIHPLLGAARALAGDSRLATAVIQEALATAQTKPMLATGGQLLLNALGRSFHIGLIGPYRLPGTRESLNRYHLAGLPVIALSDELNLSHRLEAGSRPDPALFTWALKKAACPPSQAAFVSDRVDLALAPAKAAGLLTIWSRHTNYKMRHPRSAMERPDLTVESLSDLARLVD